MARKPSCECGTCQKCKHRAYVLRWREPKTKAATKRIVESLEAMRAYREQQAKDAAIRALGPRDPGSTLCPSKVFVLRESK